MKQITDVLGRTLPVEKLYADGSWNCPFCYAAVSPTRDICRGRASGYAVDCTEELHCANPACCANPHYPVDRARVELASSAAKKAEKRRLEDIRQWNAKRTEEDRVSANALLKEICAEAEKRGACVNCACRTLGKPKFIRHRGKCKGSA